jgi:uncharacterized membrane protein YphA (DoxX/SURF4 family)
MSLRIKAILSWILRLLAAVIMLQTLFFKFTGAPESVYIFSKLGIEPWGRIGTGVMELIASTLILIPRTTALGALLAVGIMGGAILTHIFFLDIAVQGDGGQLFLYAVLVFISSLVLLILYWRQLLQLLPARLLPKKLSNI